MYISLHNIFTDFSITIASDARICEGIRHTWVSKDKVCVLNSISAMVSLVLMECSEYNLETFDDCNDLRHYLAVMRPQIFQTEYTFGHKAIPRISERLRTPSSRQALH
jgi:hypothetical protein